jgi:hypothetical protein
MVLDDMEYVLSSYSHFLPDSDSPTDYQTDLVSWCHLRNGNPHQRYHAAHQAGHNPNRHLPAIAEYEHPFYEVPKQLSAHLVGGSYQHTAGGWLQPMNP